MRENDAIELLDFLSSRVQGWDIAVSMNNRRGVCDMRTRQSRRASDLMVDLALHRPKFEDLLDWVVGGKDIAAAWPDALQAVVRFRLWHSVPREINEPLSVIGREHRMRIQGLQDWPAFLDQYRLPASVDDHPAFPPLSDLFLAWQATPFTATRPSNVIPFPGRLS